jgi:hypothetical protein
VKEPLRAKLEKAAKHNGVSMTGEMGRRLEESFRADKREAEVYGPPHVARVAQTVAAMMESVEHRTGQKATEDRETFAALQMAVAGYFGLPFGGIGTAKTRKLGEEVASDALRNLGELDQTRVAAWLARAKE